jgi:hypothetical protein
VAKEKEEALQKLIAETLQLWSFENGALAALYRADDASEAARKKYEGLLRTHASEVQVREIAARALVALHELELDFFALSRALIARGLVTQEDLQKARGEVQDLSELYRKKPG